VPQPTGPPVGVLILGFYLNAALETVESVLVGAILHSHSLSSADLISIASSQSVVRCAPDSLGVPR
jgi:hypothetical protein